MNNLVRIAAVTLFVLALVLAVVGLVSGQRKPSAAQGPAPAPAAAVTHPTVVAAKPVPAGHTLTAEDLRLEPFPSRLEGSYDTTTALVGEVVGVALSPGAPVLKTFLSQSFALEVPAGARAVAVRVDEAIGVANRIRPGDQVDVFVMLKQSGDEVGASSARLLLSRLQVLTYGDKQTAAPDSNASADRANRSDTARTAVLAVPVDQVPALLLGESSGRLALALRHPDDPGRPQADLWTNAPVLPVRNATTPEDRALAGARLDSLAGGAARPASAPARVAGPAPAAARKPEQRSVEVVRSGKRENVTY
ncbi:Flp pilus assembly protein CpaB [Aquabacterium sp. A08]|uniref:Flp pilus assembly protein CpaB n=1 Tax=Aquabacterium sp. A08 TaxID=2718532 RepID=UPI0014205B49|nr:Flp pilus assembly protein CpaB [Aquabacterium sp. A08]NIC40980.1 Flp pilus assembly protein CpaB [Aquabacterium sp. A08]